jgi:exodeoxyribonuclease V beta subunit
VAREKRPPVQASDITVLVRNRQEASLIRDALRALAIPRSISPTAIAF